MNIVYGGHCDDAWLNYNSWLTALIRRTKPERVLEVGGGAVPAIPLSDLPALGIREYSVLDISQKELDKAPDGYNKICADICSNVPLQDEYDLVISRMLAEHVRDPRKFHSNIRQLLSQGGRAFHFFPTMFCSAYIANRLIPERLGWKLLKLISPDRTQSGQKDKFPAYYRWCFGPVPWQISRLKKLGYEVESYTGFFGHSYYNRIPLLGAAHKWFTSRLMRKPNPYFTTVVYLVLIRTQESLG